MENPGNSDAITRKYMDSLLVETRYMDGTLAETTMEVFGKYYDTPVMTAALSHLEGTAPGGMAIYAEGAKKANALHWVGMGDEKELADILATGADAVKIVKPLADHDEIIRELKNAEEAGCVAVGMDIDHAFSSDGKYDEVFGIPMRAPSQEEMATYVKATNLPFVVKGVMSVTDAVKSKEIGAAGIVVSHHHGMISYSVPPLMVLPGIVQEVGDSMCVFVDCGFESGMDVYKALALGAKGVSVGRHLMPYVKEGSDAVAGRIREMTAELKGIMCRTGVKDLARMDPTVLHRYV